MSGRGRAGRDDVYETYALALVLRDEGLDDAAIAHALEIEEQLVGPLLALARAELAHLERRAGQSCWSTGSPARQRPGPASQASPAVQPST